MLTKSPTQRAITAIATIAVGTAFAATGAHAAIFSANANPFPQGSGFILNAAPGFIEVSPTEATQEVYISNLSIYNYEPITVGGQTGIQEELIATFSANFVNPTGGAPSGTATLALLPGTYFTVDVLGGFNPLTNNVGTFPETLISASFSGTDSNGNALTASLGGTPSTGTVTISPTTGGYDISNAFTVYAVATVNGAPVTVPNLGASGTPAPEPASLGLLAVSMIGTVFARRHRRSV